MDNQMLFKCHKCGKEFMRIEYNEDSKIRIREIVVVCPEHGLVTAAEGIHIKWFS